MLPILGDYASATTVLAMARGHGGVDIRPLCTGTTGRGDNCLRLRKEDDQEFRTMLSQSSDAKPPCVPTFLVDCVVIRLITKPLLERRP
jgi:hypothetical protein